MAAAEKAGGLDSIPPFLPVRMLNEFAYCPRLGYLEWVQGEFADNDETVEGRYHHRNVERTRQRARRDDGENEVQKIHERSVWLGSETLGLSAKIDLLEGEGRCVMPVDYKRGKRPHVPKGAYEPELVQLCAQGLLLRDHGYECDEGVLFFVGSRERVRVVFDDELVTRTVQLAAQMRAVAAAGPIPPPLVDSPKCPRCRWSASAFPTRCTISASTAERRTRLARWHRRATTRCRCTYSIPALGFTRTGRSCGSSMATR